MRALMGVQTRVVAEEDVAVVAEHIGAAGFRSTFHGATWEMQCPSCARWDYGPTAELWLAVELYLRGGRWPHAVLLAGACMDCGHIVSPEAADLLEV